jgi:hypothetical protein
VDLTAGTSSLEAGQGWEPIVLDLPFEHVIVSHGEPVHIRAAYERALKAAPWSG